MLRGPKETCVTSLLGLPPQIGTDAKPSPARREDRNILPAREQFRPRPGEEFVPEAGAPDHGQGVQAHVRETRGSPSSGLTAVTYRENGTGGFMRASQTKGSVNGNSGSATASPRPLRMVRRASSAW